MKFKCITLGCKVNSYESQYYAEELSKLNFTVAKDDEVADLYIVNTCAVTNTAASKSRQRIHAAKKENPDAIIVAVGCYIQYLDEAQREQLGVDLVIGTKHKKDLPNLVEEYISTHKKVDVVESVQRYTEFESMPIHKFESKHRAFLKIQDGCNQFCSYCAIPYARGRERSYNHEEVITVAKQLVEKGHSEIVLTGIHTGRYDSDSYNLTKLLEDLLKATPEYVYFRISSIEITEVSDDLIHLIQSTNRICHHLHVPVQSACDATLKRMNRPYTIAYFKERMDYLRNCVPDISVSTDVIAGFVQETEEEFNTTYENLKDIKFSFLHVFPYSKRDGTASSRMSGEINGKIKKERVKKLLALSKQLRQEDMDRFNPVQVLVETFENGAYSGYTDHYHPIKIYTDQSLSGRIDVSWDKIENEVYIA